MSYLNLLILGYLPWVLIDYLSKYFRPIFAIVITLIIITIPIFKSIKLKDYVGLTFVTGVIAYAINKIYPIYFFTLYSKCITLIVSIVAILSVILHKPFTIVYATKIVSKDKWNNPIFIKINNIISLVWALIFLLEFLMRINSVSNWVNIILVIIGLKFSKNFPNYYVKK